MKIVYFTHSLRSCWNHGNAHFLRGVLRELQVLGHEVIALEPTGSWSFSELQRDQGIDGTRSFQREYPELDPHEYATTDAALHHLEGAEIVIVHEWNDPALVAAVGGLRARGATFMLLFHDTHHRAVSDPDAVRAFNLSAYDGILAFGETLAEVYRRWGWGHRVFVWHEAADTRLFRPLSGRQDGAVWIGNWGDGERTDELSRYLFDPVWLEGIALELYGVRYPAEARRQLKERGITYHGWVANADVPRVFADHRFTVHVPRRFYAETLPGIPTIRVFEALACGIPLICAPWDDCEHLFAPGEDYLVARNGIEMREHMRALNQDEALRNNLRRSGLDRILSHHTCRHRAAELIAIHQLLDGSRLQGQAI